MDQIVAYSVCPVCRNSIDLTDFFCRACGAKLKEKPPSISLFKQLSLYALSFLLPPFGLIPAIKYLRQEDSKSKQVGIIAIVLTVISLIVSIMLIFNFMNTYSQAITGQIGTF